MTRRFLLAVAMAAVAAFTGSVPVAAASSSPGTASTPATSLVTCSVSPGHYCARIVYTSTTNGIYVNATNSTGYTTGPGKGKEWFRYSCSSGTCYIVPSALFTYSRADVQLNVHRTFSGSGFFLPCKALFGVDYINPAVNAPGPGAILFHVTC